VFAASQNAGGSDVKVTYNARAQEMDDDDYVSMHRLKDECIQAFRKSNGTLSKRGQISLLPLPVNNGNFSFNPPLTEMFEAKLEVISRIFSANGREDSTRFRAFLRRDAATIFMAFVIFWVDLTDFILVFNVFKFAIKFHVNMPKNIFWHC
jgi:hypothetical protein